jgi:arginine utilization protein RocB
MEQRISLVENFWREFEAIKIQRVASEKYRKLIARRSKLIPPETKIVTHQDRLNMIKKLGEDSERRRKQNDEIQTLLASFRTRRFHIKPRLVQKN